MHRKRGYQRLKVLSNSPLRTLVRVCSRRWAPRSVHAICCFFTNRLLTTWLMVDSTNAVLIVSPCRLRSPKLGMNSRLFRMYVSNSVTPAAIFSAAAERAWIKLRSISGTVNFGEGNQVNGMLEA